MSRIHEKSLASWRAAHGFGILAVIDPRGEHFFVVPSAADSADTHQVPWLDMSEAQLRTYLGEKGFPDSEIDDAVRLSREWVTTTTSSRLFAARRSS